MIRLRITAAIIALALLSGCMGTDYAAPEEAAATEQTTETDIQPQEEKPVYGGTLRLSMRKPHTLNPLLNEDITVDRVLKLMFEPLFVQDKEQNIQPNLADGFLLSDDGKSMAVSLRSDALWSDGTPITADDLIFSLDTIKAASSASVYKSAMTNVSGYHKTGDTTVIIEYSAPYGGCEYNLCFPLIPKHYYEGNNTVSSPKSMQPLGNGLYTFSDYRLVRDMRLKAGSNFRGSPYIENIIVTVMNDKETEIAAFEQGLIDVISMTCEEYGAFNSQNQVNAEAYDTNQFEFLGFNFKNSALSNKSIRQAIACAIPMDNIIDNIYLGNGVKSITPIHPHSSLSGDIDEEAYSYNLNRAKTLVAGTGLSVGQLTFTILVNEENTARCETAELIASELNQTGMQVTVYRVPFESYLSLLQSDSFTMFLGGAELTSRVDLRPLLSSASQSSGINYFNYGDAQMDNILNRCASAVGGESYKAAVGEAQRYCADQLPLIGISFKPELLLTDGAVGGSKNPGANDIFRGINNWYISDKTEDEKEQ